MAILDVIYNKSVRTNRNSPSQCNEGGQNKSDNPGTYIKFGIGQQSDYQNSSQASSTSELDNNLFGRDTLSDSSPARIKISQQQQAFDYQGLFNLAISMEEARSDLLSIIITNPELLIIFAGSFVTQLHQGCEFTELLTFKQLRHQDGLDLHVDLEPLRFKKIQSELKVIFKEILKPGMQEQSKEERLKLYNIHFLPVFLNQVTTEIEADPSINDAKKVIIESFRKELMQSRQKIVEGNVRLVTYTAKQFKHSKLPFPDLLQEGSVGLIKAVDRYDCQRGVKFSTYAIYWIRQTISRFIIKQERTVRLPFSFASKASLVFDTIHTRLQLTDRWPSVLELSRLCQLKEQDVSKILKYYQPGVSIFSPVNNDVEMPDLLATLEQHHYPQPFDVILKKNLSTYIDLAIESLPKRDAEILCARFGIHNRVEMTLQEIADQLHLSRERVRQIQNNAINQLKLAYTKELQDFLNVDLAVF